MACGGCNSNRQDKPAFAGSHYPHKRTPQKESSTLGVVKNMASAAMKQPDFVKWFVDGATGLLRSLGGQLDYTPEDVLKNRAACKTCEFSTKDERGNSTAHSQCMAPDPNNNNAPCGCFILAKTETGECPLGKWKTTKLTINGQ